MISGIDYIFYTSKDASTFFMEFETELKVIWEHYYKEEDFEDNMYNAFYALDKVMFDEMDNKGFYLNKNGEGPFYLIFNPKYSNIENRITVVLPSIIEESMFCKKIYEIVVKVE